MSISVGLISTISTISPLSGDYEVNLLLLTLKLLLKPFLVSEDIAPESTKYFAYAF